MGARERDAAAEITQLFVELMTDKLVFIEREESTHSRGSKIALAPEPCHIS